eukprot:CAMPEP_0175883882 /NCGR_PEP_ID=MMETSP0107_2-20121207/44220_1 /TAXON_ID=195067 ORGANISM="Goniomonas pacifica, Strain CCMP1869" /NCGR_SAMPLE_ID=MMETSP0107_2 /ASSEMBLY_ACC=CAM_ASM_000203 /LENGTH=80 /DNA_ID=CAMNT_0017203987 /DNA_START=253 /DNA_END=491 /DNA_ORIENTATION=-
MAPASGRPGGTSWAGSLEGAPSHQGPLSPEQPRTAIASIPPAISPCLKRLPARCRLSLRPAACDSSAPSHLGLVGQLHRG